MTYDPTLRSVQTVTASSRGLSTAVVAVKNADLRAKVAQAITEMVEKSQAEGEPPNPKTSETLIQQTLFLDLSELLSSAKPDSFQVRETVKALAVHRASGKTAATKGVTDPNETKEASDFEKKLYAEKK